MVGIGSARMDVYLEKIRVKMSNKPEQALAELNSSLDIDASELSAFQSLKSRAMLAGIITENEAQQLYLWLGESPHTFNCQPLEVKVLVTTMVKEMIEKLNL